MLVRLFGGPLENKVKDVPEQRAYYWFPIGENLWSYYYLDPKCKKTNVVVKGGSGVKNKTKTKKSKIDIFYISCDKTEHQKDSNCDVKTFMDAFERKHGYRPDQKSFREFS